MTSACRAGTSLETQGKIMERGTVWTDSMMYWLLAGSQAALNIYLHFSDCDFSAQLSTSIVRLALKVVVQQNWMRRQHWKGLMAVSSSLSKAIRNLLAVSDTCS